MFTLIAMRGNVPSDSTSRYNVLFGSALLLLVADPTLIYDTGFRLSYLSVLSIMFFIPKIVSCIPDESPVKRNLLLNTIFMAAVITSVVQIFTMPLTLYAFGQISTVSLLNNMAVAILASPLMILTVIYRFCPMPVIDHSIKVHFRRYKRHARHDIGHSLRLHPRHRVSGGSLHSRIRSAVHDNGENRDAIYT